MIFKKNTRTHKQTICRQKTIIITTTNHEKEKKNNLNISQKNQRPKKNKERAKKKRKTLCALRRKNKSQTPAAPCALKTNDERLAAIDSEDEERAG